MDKNRFSVLLVQLINTAEVKHGFLAQELNFDVSYISKWVNGRALPSEKNIEETIEKISETLVKHASPNGLKQMYRDYRVNRTEELQAAIYENLIAEYYYVVDMQQDQVSAGERRVSFYPWLSMQDVLNKMHHPVLRRVKNLDIMAAIDLFSIENEYRIRMVSLGVNSTAINYEYPSVHFCLLIDLMKMRQDIIRNTIFISNMLRMLSHVDFRFYSGEFARGKMMFLVKNELAVSGILIRPDTCAAVVVCEGSENTRPLYNCIQTLCTREALLFQKLDIIDVLVNSTDYVRSLLSPGRSWLVGHMTEHILPPDLFQELAANSRLGAQNYKVDGMLRLHRLGQSVLSNPDIRVLISERAIARFVITGEVDFFTEIMTLTCEQRVRTLEYFLDRVRSVKTQIKLLHEPVVSDFGYTVMPSLFLSDTLSFIRLPSINQRENLLLKINRKEIQNIHKEFVDLLWEQKTDMVSDSEALERFLTEQLDGLRILADTMGDDETGETNGVRPKD